MTRRILLVGHPGRQVARESACTLVRELAVHGIEITGERAEIEAFGVADEPNVVTGDGVDPTRCELAVVLGGDGTILRAAEVVRGSGLPLLGVNLGHVGFLAEAERDNLRHTVDKIASRNYHVERRDTLDVEVSYGGQVVWRSWALNEASVEKAARERMLEVVVEVDGRPLSTWGCDGVVMATPTGSTAYAFSAGGPIVWPGVEALLLVPISAHALFARSLVLSLDVKIAVEVLPTATAKGVVWADGRRAYDIQPGARISVRRSETPVLLARLSDAPFTDRLVRKFDLSVSGWRGSTLVGGPPAMPGAQTEPPDEGASHVGMGDGFR